MSKSETYYNSHLIHTSLKACRRLLRINYNVDFVPGETRLQSMLNQMQKQQVGDKRLSYNCDGVIQFQIDDIANDLLILETSQAYDSGTRVKASFDHTKGMFGLLSMLKTIADNHAYASTAIIKKLKIHLLHVHGKWNDA